MDGDDAEGQADKHPIRRAVVVGINEYEHDKLENLSGAVHDATEIRDIMKDNGGFIIDNDHFLIDKGATCERIRMAISDLLWKREQCDIVLFYFAGHGLRDPFEHGYLMPHDADYAAPFVRGIRIQELKELFLRSTPKTTGIMILDCCYSGVATQGERSSPGSAKHIESFREELRLENKGSGRFILASADADKTAREEKREHALTGEKHIHGLFSFQLIEGLRIGPKDDFGRVSLGTLVKHLEDAFKGDPKHTPQLNVSAASGVHDIFLTTIAEVLRKRLQERLDEVKDLLSAGAPMAVIAAIQALNELEKQGLGCDQANQYFGDIDKFFKKAEMKLTPWWVVYRPTMMRSLLKGNWYEILNNILSDFKLDTIRQLDATKMSVLGLVIDVVERNQDPQLIVRELRMLERDSRDVAPITSPDVRASPSASLTLS